MAVYQYRVRDKFGKLTSGTMDASAELIVAAKLKESGFTPISIKVTEEAAFKNLLKRFRRVKLVELNMFTRQFAALQRAGLAMIATMGALREQATNKILEYAISQITNHIKEGASLSSALAKFPKIFSPLYVNMVQAGEESGTLIEVLERLATLGEHEERLRLRVKSATRYPIMVVASVVIAFLILTIFVVPRFAKVYSEAGVALPLPTLILIWTNYALIRFWWLVLLVVGILVFTFRKYINSEKGRFQWDDLKLKIPVFGPLVLKATMSRFSRINAAMLRSGITILRTLDLSGSIVGNVVISRVIQDIKTSIQEGKGMAEAMKRSGLFPTVVIQMVSVGEQTGRMDELLLHVSDYYDQQVEYTVENFTSLIEPILIFILGCGVLLMALGIFLPMWNLIQVFRR